MIILRDSITDQWLEFREPVEVVQTSRPGEVLPSLDRIESLVQEERLYGAGFLSYEAAPAFDEALEVHSDKTEFPLLWFGLYSAPRSHSQLASDVSASYSTGEWKPNISRDSYLEAFRRIRSYLREGDTYQVNYSFRQRCSFSGSPVGLFRDLSSAQPTNYAAFLDLGRYAVCSASPELFFTLQGNQILTKPMKGTMARGKTLEEDRERMRQLRASDKEQAENVMIVDMIRNDLGRIAQTGSVNVRALFEVERYPTLWQMISTIAAQTEASVGEILQALFPCASVTGAPKPRTMQIIAGLEQSPRRIYTGSIGYLAPDRTAQFNVAIRTVLIDTETQTAEYGTGGGIVWDSEPEREYTECLVKARFLTEHRPEFSLLESILWNPGDGYFLLEYHLRRLSDSAEYFDIPLDIARVRGRLIALHNELESGERKVRVLADQNGEIICEASAPLPEPSETGPILLGFASEPVDRENPFLYHKTTYREMYDRFRSEQPECDDVILWNVAGEVTETTIANLVIRKEGQFLTPPVDCGLLAGTFRAWLLDHGRIREHTLVRKDVENAERIYLINSVRKWREAYIKDH